MTFGPLDPRPERPVTGREQETINRLFHDIRTSLDEALPDGPALATVALMLDTAKMWAYQACREDT